MDEQQANEEQPQGEIQPEQNDSEAIQEQTAVEAPAEKQTYPPEVPQVDQNIEIVPVQQPEPMEQQAPEPGPSPEVQPPAPEQHEVQSAPVTVFTPPAAIVTQPEQPAPQAPIDRVSSLTDEELEAAHRLWQSKKIREYQRMSVTARKARQQAALDKVLAFVQDHSPTQIPRMANELDMSPRLVAHYLQKLVKSGQVRAEGWSKGRKYSTD